MITSAVFENYGNGTSVEFNTNNIPFRRFFTYEDWRTEEREKAQEHGLWPSYTYFGRRMWQVEGDILEANSVDYVATRRDIKRVLMPAPHLGFKAVGRLKISFDGLEEMYSECTIDGAELPVEASAPARGEFMIIWKAFDPRCYSSTEYSATLGTPNIVAGRTYPKTFNKTYSALVGTNQITATNNGDIETFPQVEIHGPVERPKLILVRGSDEYEFTLEDLIIPAGQIAYIDFRGDQRSVISNSGADWYAFSHNSVWWPLEPGDNLIRFEALAASAPAKAVIKWRNAYMP